MKNRIKKLLFDILSAINNIDSYIGENRKFEDYDNNPMLQDAVERNLEIIGEAMNKLLVLDQSLVITESELSCGAKMANIIYIGQKYFQLEQEVCGLTYAVPWTSYPPHDILKLWAEGKHIIYYRQQ